MEMMKKFLDGKFDPYDFSFDFPECLASLTPKLEKENRALSELLNEDMPEICADYEPEPVVREGQPGLLDMSKFKKKLLRFTARSIRSTFRHIVWKCFYIRWCYF
ncbi:hypothetical protein Q4O60_07360 [Aeribacillus pallidus]|nr:hypothetical protein [Aeribacillus pallidus]